MTLKKIIKKIIPDKLVYDYKLKKYNKKRMYTYSQIEKNVDNKYYKLYNKNINWKKPVSYTEKMNFAKIYLGNKEKSQLTDKYLVRKYISNKIGEEYLIPILGVYDKFEDIDFKCLPNEFVIKCNHDSGSTTIVENKNKLNLKKLKEKYDYFLNRNYAFVTNELHYGDIKPKILIEKYMGKDINDYKFLCFNGKPYYCWVDYDRFSNHKRNIYNMDWEIQPFQQSYYEKKLENIDKPSKFDEIVNVVKKLCDGFDHVRVDLYFIEGKIYFGELTFTNGSGLEAITPNEWDTKLGELWNIDISERNKKINKKIIDDMGGKI